MQGHRRTDTHAQAHGRPHMHGRAPPVHGRALVVPERDASATVHPCGTPVRSLVFLCFAILGAREFFEPLIFLEITREVFFSIKT